MQIYVVNPDFSPRACLLQRLDGNTTGICAA